MVHIRVEVTENTKEGFTSLVFAPRDANQESMDQIDTILKSFLDPNATRRGGWVAGALRLDVKFNPEEDENDSQSD